MKQEEIREKILHHLYTVQKEATSASRSSQNERQIFHAFMDMYEKSEVISNLLYLVDAGWIKTKKLDKITYYSIKDKGVNHFEGKSSVFQKGNFLSGVNITNINGITVIGNNNVVRQEYSELYRNLEILREKIGESQIISDPIKLDSQSEIDTIKSQLAKREPNKSIISQAWSALSTVATLEGVIQFYQTVEPLIKHLLT